MKPMAQSPLWRLGNLGLATLMIWTATIALPERIFADEEPGVSSSPDGSQSSDPSEERILGKRRQAMAGLMVVSGILIVGVVFLAGVAIWGARLRRLARRELPAQTTLQNDLWFLKATKPVVTEADSEKPDATSPGA